EVPRVHREPETARADYPSRVIRSPSALVRVAGGAGDTREENTVDRSGALMDPAVTSLVVLAGAVALFVWNRLSVGVVAVLTALALHASGVFTAEQSLAGFGDPVVVFVASLFVVSEGLDASGVTAWAGQAITERAGTGRRPLLLAFMVLAGVL